MPEQIDNISENFEDDNVQELKFTQKLFDQKPEREFWTVNIPKPHLPSKNFMLGVAVATAVAGALAWARSGDEDTPVIEGSSDYYGEIESAEDFDSSDD